MFMKSLSKAEKNEKKICIRQKNAPKRGKHVRNFANWQ